MSEEIVYGEWDDGRGNLIRLVSQVFKKQTVVHLRRYWQPTGDGGAWVPTRYGVMLNEEQFRELRRAMDYAGQKLEW